MIRSLKRLSCYVIACGVMICIGTSFKSQNDSMDLTGRWMRIADDWEGMEVEVNAIDDHYEAVLLQLPSHAMDWGFKPGDVKWIISENTLEDRIVFSDLYFRRGGNWSSYKNSLMSISSPDTLRTQLLKYNGETIGRKQIWVRQKPLLTSL